MISSLQFSAGILAYKRAWKKAKYIQVLHGFPCPINGQFKAECINAVARFSRKHFDYVVTVSYMSWAVNYKINRIKCDAVINNGCELKQSGSEQARNIDVVFIGRLFRDKGIDLIADSFLEVLKTNPSLNLCVAGYGEMEEKFTSGKYANNGIHFLGKLSQSQVKETLSKSKFFISMNSLEPFGTVFLEAVINGCNIITQSTTGVASLFFNKPYFHLADTNDSTKLANIIVSSTKAFAPVPQGDKQAFADYLSYSRVAEEYKKLATTSNDRQ